MCRYDRKGVQVSYLYLKWIGEIKSPCDDTAPISRLLSRHLGCLYWFDKVHDFGLITKRRQTTSVKLQMERHPQNKVQDGIYDKIVVNLKELNGNVAKMNALLADTNKINETAVLVGGLNAAYLESVSFQMDMQLNAGK